MSAPVLLVDGNPASPLLAAAIISIRVEQVLGVPAQLLLLFADLPAEGGTDLRLGTAITVKARDGVTLIEAEITAIAHQATSGGGPTLMVRGYDRLHRLRKKQAVRALPATSLVELVREAADAVGATPVTPPGLPGPRFRLQHEGSDFDHLRDAAAECGCYLRLGDGRLEAFTLAGDGADAATLRLGANLYEARIEASAEALRRSVAVVGWGLDGDAITARATVAAQDQVDIEDGGALQGFEGLGDRLLPNRRADTPEEAMALAQADLDVAAARARTFTGLAEGDPALRPGRRVSVVGVGPRADGMFVLTRAVHQFSAERGHVVELDTTPPARPARAMQSTSTVGIVTNCDDPEQLGRVKALLPAFFDNVETDWMQVLALGAGAGKGAAIFPEIDDRVLVLFTDGDPARGVVLGGLWGRQALPSPADAASPRAYVLRTPGGQQLTLDSHRPAIRLETAAGDLLDISPDGARLHVTRDLTIEAPGRRLRIRADRVDFEQG
ncbi:hypothetical protein GCM10007973_08580 [Polymorphobacter multimanifer]|uniref:Phage baseplate assembly protein gpV/phage protein D n=1 Tax=Polymorphobacter multimanifer TaxID=1070431 RepID=A0A841L645_9SPHN|nr:phage baseplate assembly protein V [Polymorphobacter multimanifer]MBB6228074.1 phage baseplate assembly protein gpV/phage protein D [Polymorphobacter multimanifer]GGI74027.1 hypothetical protein GCM10007973_08580 [Polymorphobacter multimanifer]